MKKKLTDEARLRHILDAIHYIEEFSANKAKEDFLNDPMYRFSVERQLEIIGEATSKLTTELQATYSKVPWAQIISFRNFLAHEYFGLDPEIVWGIIQLRLPEFKSDIERILQEINSHNDNQ